MFSLGFDAGGWFGIRAITAMLAAAIVVAIFALFASQLRSTAAGLCGTMLFVLLGADRLQARPTLFTILLAITLCAHLLTRGDRWQWRDAIAATALTLVWVNLHSVGLIALALYGAWLFGAAAQRVSRPRPLARHVTTLGLMTAVCCLTPAGLDLLAFALQDKRDVMQYVSDEWATFHFAWSANESLRPEAYVAILSVLGFLLAAYLAIGIALQRRPRPQRPWPDAARVTLLVALLAGGLSARRFHWMLALATLLAMTTLRDLHRAGAFTGVAALTRRPALRAGALALLALPSYGALRHDGIALHSVVASGYGERLAAPFRMAGVEFLRFTGLRGNLFCHYGSGGQLLHTLHPHARVFIDSRIDLYGRDVYLDWLAVRNGRPDQLEILDRYETDVFYRHWDLSPPLDADKWLKVYEGCDGAIYLRRGRPGFEDNVERARTWPHQPGTPPRGH